MRWNERFKTFVNAAHLSQDNPSTWQVRQVKIYDCASTIMHDYCTSVPWLVGHNKSQHLLCIELIRLLTAAWGMLVNSSSMTLQICWILAGIGARCRTCLSRASQTSSMGDTSGEYAGQARTGMFSASRNCVQIFGNMGPCVFMLQREVTAVDEWHDNGPRSHHRIFVHSNCHQ